MLLYVALAVVSLWIAAATLILAMCRIAARADAAQFGVERAFERPLPRDAARLPLRASTARR